MCMSCTISTVTKEETYDAVFSIREATKCMEVTDAAETNVKRWAVMMFDTDNPDAWYYSSSEGSDDITCTVRKDRSYTAYAIANYPPDFSPSLIQGEDHLLQYPSLLSENAADALVMFGSKNLEELPSGTTQIPLKRLCSKVEIKKISVNMSDAVYAAQEFVLNAVYLTNVYMCSSFSSDNLEPDSDSQYWYNALGWHGSGTVRMLDDILGDRGLGVTINNGGSYETKHVFYTYPNASSTDSDSDEWSRRRTRLVIEATLGGKKYYYTVTLPAMKRNNCYTVTEASIRKPGSLDPEKTIPGIIDANITISKNTWDSEYYTSEES